MDVGVEPLPGVFTFIVDGVEKTPTAIVWDDATHLALEYDEAVLGPTVVRCRLSAKDPLLRSQPGELVTPFDILVTAP